ncbi:MAG: transferrin-binding protein-like solute binding protein [Geminicoccaceae bacterium]
MSRRRSRGGIASATDAAGYFGGVETSLPTSGTASYAGSATAIEVRNDKTAQGLYTGTMTASVDFRARTLAGSMDLANAAQGSNLVIETGQMKLNSTTGRFAGANFTSSAGHAGFGDGRFFGPEQNEIGGAFNITNDQSTVVGGFGAAKVE